MKKTKRGVYIAVDHDGDVYAGESMSLPRRKNEHARNGRYVIASWEIPAHSLRSVERRMIRFLVNQSSEEDFDCTNKETR